MEISIASRRSIPASNIYSLARFLSHLFSLPRTLFCSLSVGTSVPEIAPEDTYGHPLIRYVKIIPCCIGHAIRCVDRLPLAPSPHPSFRHPTFRSAPLALQRHLSRSSRVSSRCLVVGRTGRLSRSDLRNANIATRC